MADNKRSFLLYIDLLATIEKLPDDVSGKLFKIILEYVNDKDPQIDDLLLQIAFEPIKQQLKRDLKEWESIRETRSEVGKIGGLKSAESRRLKQNEANQPNGSFASKDEANSSKGNQDEANQAVNVTVNATVKRERGKKEKISLPETIDFKKQFAGQLKWEKEKLKFYFDVLTDWSEQGNKYVSWIAAARQFERSDKLKNKGWYEKKPEVKDTRDTPLGTRDRLFSK